MKVYLLKPADFDELKQRIELSFRKEAEHQGQEWNLSRRQDDERGPSIYDNWRKANYDICRWVQEHSA